MILTDGEQSDFFIPFPFVVSFPNYVVYGIHTREPLNIYYAVKTYEVRWNRAQIPKKRAFVYTYSYVRSVISQHLCVNLTIILRLFFYLISPVC